MGALQQRRRGAASGKVAGAAQPRARQRRACPRVRCGAHRVGRTTRNGVRGGVKFDRPALARSNAIVAGSDAVFAPHHILSDLVITLSRSRSLQGGTGDAGAGASAAALPAAQESGGGSCTVGRLPSIELGALSLVRACSVSEACARGPSAGSRSGAGALRREGPVIPYPIQPSNVFTSRPPTERLQFCTVSPASGWQALALAPQQLQG